GRTVEGFNAGEVIQVPPVLNEETREALKTAEMTLVVNGVTLKYGEAIAMGDFYADANAMMTASPDELKELVRLIQQDKASRNVGTDQWQKATNNRYAKLAEQNEPHFAAPDPGLAGVSGKSTIDHKSQWERFHAAALLTAQSGDRDKALATNGFADHFLTDAFAAGHLVNKRDVMEAFKSKLPAANSKAFFDGVAQRAFVGDLKAAFSVHETVTTKLGIHWNINNDGRFSTLLQEIYKAEPDLLANAVAKSVHDTLNTKPGGIPVENARKDQWSLSGDGTLNAKSREIAKKAVAESQLQVLTAMQQSGPLNLAGLNKAVWDYVPRPTAQGQQLIQQEVASGTDPKSAPLVDAVVQLLKDNHKAILAELVGRNYLRHE
ncbi:MAG TPA: hypothetical protein VFP10_14880, partial [Candidatus Eisenbacteria bacterium]|nr:hypothetical protein [Candidatus Eisenbacteria bacterium]